MLSATYALNSQSAIMSETQGQHDNARVATDRSETGNGEHEPG